VSQKSAKAGGKNGPPTPKPRLQSGTAELSISHSGVRGQSTPTVDPGTHFRPWIALRSVLKSVSLRVPHLSPSGRKNSSAVKFTTRNASSAVSSASVLQKSLPMGRDHFVFKVLPCPAPSASKSKIVMCSPLGEA
jgi:hypothetical protein